MLHQPAVHRVRRELNTVIGSDRLPDFGDINHIPYVNAFIHEVLRWRTITPLGIPHAVIQDDECTGYHIPRGTTVLANNWALESDKTLFKDTDAFHPDLWLEAPKLPTSAFGFGKRTCPGRSMSHGNLYSLSFLALCGVTILVTLILQSVGRN